MDQAEITYWKDTAEMCRKARDERVLKWNALKERLKLEFEVKGVKGQKIYISRFYKIVREIIASVAYAHPHIYVKPEADPADASNSHTLAKSGPILEDFANDSLEIMRCAPIVQQSLFDALFCYNGFIAFDYLPGDSKGVAPYLATDAMMKGFTYIRRVKPEYVLTDPLVEPHDFNSSRYVGEEMFIGIEDLVEDERFSDHKEALSKLKNNVGRTSVNHSRPGQEDWLNKMPEGQKESMSEAHRLAKTVRCVQWTDRVTRRRIFFADGIEEPIEEIEHPFLRDDQMETRTDPNPDNTRPLLSRTAQQVEDQTMNEETGTTLKVDPNKKWLVEGGIPYFRLNLDVCDDFWGTPMMEYENEYQNAIIRIVTRKVQILDRFKRMAKVKKEELENNPSIRQKLKDPEDGEVLELLDMEALQELTWGTIPSGEDSLMNDILNFEAESIRTVGSANEQNLATGKALAASTDEMNREFNQGPISKLYIWIAKNTFSMLSYEPFTPNDMLLKTTSEVGAEQTEIALEAWHLQGRYNFNVAAGSSNILYEKMNRAQSGELAQAVASSPNIDRLKLDKYVIRAWGEVDPETLLKDAANTDAAKSAALEIELFFAHAAEGYDPGVTPGEDHQTHIRMQSPEAIQKHPRFAASPPPIQQAVLQASAKHIQAHQQQQQQEAGVSQGQGAAISAEAGTSKARDLIGEAQSFAQKTSNRVTKEAESA